jgi:Spy/CpxP family protein refolding chaperone
MKSNLKQAKLLFTVAIIAFAACWTSNYFIHAKPMAMDAHDFLHKELNISDDQDRQLKDVEQRFADRKIVLEGTIREANAELGKAIVEDKHYSDRVKAAVNRIHAAQGELQKATLEHFFDMQQALTQEQAAKLNHMAADALIHHP